MRPISILRMGGRPSGGQLDTQTVTSGAGGTALAGNRVRGFVSGSLGSINDGTSNLYSGAAILQLLSVEDGGDFDVQLQIAGVVANSGWTSMNVGGTNILTRASAAFSTTGGNSTWAWSLAGQLFGGAGTVVIVGFD